MARFRAIQTWRIARRLPRWIALADIDNELPIDLDNVFSVETLVELIKGRDQATLVEVFPRPDQLCARGPEGRFVHELVVPFVRRQERDKTQVETESRGNCHAAPVVLPSSPRRFPPGSEWLYAKLYSGRATLDQVLRDVVRPVSQAAVRRRDRLLVLHPLWRPGLAPARALSRGSGEASWRSAPRSASRHPAAAGRRPHLTFPTRHLRARGRALRRGGRDRAGRAALPRRQRSRPGAGRAIPRGRPGETRWRLALQGMDRLLTDLGFDLAGKLDVIRRTRDAFGREFRVDSQFRHQLNAKYRKDRRTVEALLAPDGERETLRTPERTVLVRRSEQWSPVIAELKAREQAGRLRQSVKELAVSYLHMHANRLLRTAHRVQELVLYDFLARNYESRAIRSRQIVNRGE